MNWKKFYGTIGISALLCFTLTACGDKKEKTAKASEESTYSYVYASDPTTLDYTFTSRAFNMNHLFNFVDGLLEYDAYGNLQPSLAEDWDVSKDGLTYTYHLRKDVPWVDSEGNEVAKVKAQDFVTGLKHACEVKSETLYVVADSIKGLNEYVSGKITDFNEVGIKAVDDNTLTYTLNTPEPYWNSKTSYGILYPINADFLKEKGKDFGSTTPDSILYNGAYLLTNFTSKSVIEYKKNDTYWDKKNVHVNNVKLSFSDGSDPDSYYKGFDEGTYSTARLYPNNPAFKEVEKKYQDNITWSMPSLGTYMLAFNNNRLAYNYTSKKSDGEKQSTQKAILNKDFRKAIQFAFNKETYLAQSIGKAGAKKGIRNTFVPGDFVSIKGQPFVTATEKYLKEADPEAFGDVSLKDGQDAYYNLDKAKSYMEKAKEALKKENVSFPIKIDIPQVETNEILVNSIKSFKKMMEDAFGKDTVEIDIQLLTKDEYSTVAETSAENDFDIFTGSGWSADYTDPKSFLNCFESNNGDLVHIIGLESQGYYKNGVDPTKAGKDAIDIKHYDELLNNANSILDDLDKRYDAYAKAEAWLLDQVLIIPLDAGGATPMISKEEPFTRPYGLQGSEYIRYKGMKLRNKAITTKEYDTLQKEWEAKRVTTNKETNEKIAQKMQGK